MKKHLTVLLADDDADDRKLFVDAVHEADPKIKCYTVEDGQQAMKFLNDPANELPDFIFLDLRMPRLSGKTCLQQIRADSRLKHIPVIIYTTSNDVEDSNKLLGEGATHFISKPTNPEEIYYIVSLILHEKWV